MRTDDRRAISLRMTWVATAAALVALLGLFALGFYQRELSHIRKNKLRELEAIADLKCGEVETWRNQQIRGVERFSTSRLVREALAEYSRDAATRASLVERLKHARKYEDLEDLLVLSPAGKILLSAKRLESTSRLSPNSIATRGAMCG
jgi:hypothetical protein